MSEQGSVHYENDGPVAVITLDRPSRHNAISVDMLHQLIDAWTLYEASSARCAILTGAGDRSFCAGLDLGPVSAQATPFWRALPSVGVPLTKPVIAAVTGHCIGGGWSLVQHCDLAIATTTSSFRFPEATIGFYGGLASSLGRHVAKKLAVEFQMLGESFPADRAAAAGLINRVVEPGTHLEQAHRWAARIAASAPLVISAIKQFADDGSTGAFERYAATQRALGVVADSADQVEGIDAFLNGRTPTFHAR